MRLLALLAVAAFACGPKPAAKQPADDDELPDLHNAKGGPGEPQGEPEPPPPEDELHRRQYAACDAIVPRMTACAVEDAKANMTPEQLKDLDVEQTSKIHTRENTKKCKNWGLNGHQVRVLEVCDQETDNCSDLRDCLDNLNTQK